MLCVKLPGLVFIVLVATDMRILQVLALRQLSAGTGNDWRNAPFGPCRTSQRISAALKKRLLKDVVSMMSACALKVANFINKSWGRPKDIRVFLPRAGTLLCMVVRVTYGYFVDRTGHLPRSLAQNGSLIYDMTLRIIKAGLTDTSSNSNLCAYAGKSRRIICYEKSRVWQTIRIGAPCIQKAMNGTAIDEVEGSLFVLFSIINSLSNSGLISYLGG